MIQTSINLPFTQSVAVKSERKKLTHARMVFLCGKTIYPVFFEESTDGGTGRSRDKEDDHWEPPTSWRSLSDD